MGLRNWKTLLITTGFLGRSQRSALTCCFLVKARLNGNWFRVLGDRGLGCMVRVTKVAYWHRV